MRKKTILFFCLILILGIIPRIITAFSNLPFTDEAGYSLLVSKKIVFDHIFPLVGFNLNYEWHITKGPGWFYTLAIPIILGNGNPIFAKIFTVFADLVGITFTFYLLKKAFDLKTATLVSFFLSVSPWFIDQVGYIWPPFFAPIFIILFLLFTMKFIQGKKNYSLLIALMLGFIGQYEIAIMIFLLGQIIILLPLAFKKKLIDLKRLLYSFLVFVITMLPIIIYDLTHNFYSLRGFVILFSELSKGHGQSILSKLPQRVDTFTWGFRSTFSPNIILSITILFILKIRK